MTLFRSHHAAFSAGALPVFGQMIKYQSIDSAMSSGSVILRSVDLVGLEPY